MTVVGNNGWFLKNKILRLHNYIIIIDTPTFIEEKDNIFIQVEPNAITNNEEYLINHANKYKYILTFNENILNTCKNSIKYIYGTTWINSDIYNNISFSNKQFLISTFSGSKLHPSASGHILRQHIHHSQHLLERFPIHFYRSSVQLPIIKDYGNNPLIENDKSKMFVKYQYAIIVENSRQINYFTEKLIDCLLCKTIPIYYGCPNISNYFDTRGWIILDSTDIYSLLTSLQTLNEKSYYHYLKTIQSNYDASHQYIDFYDNINKVLPNDL